MKSPEQNLRLQEAQGKLVPECVESHLLSTNGFTEEERFMVYFITTSPLPHKPTFQTLIEVLTGDTNPLIETRLLLAERLTMLGGKLENEGWKIDKFRLPGEDLPRYDVVPKPTRTFNSVGTRPPRTFKRTKGKDGEQNGHSSPELEFMKILSPDDQAFLNSLPPTLRVSAEWILSTDSRQPKDPMEWVNYVNKRRKNCNEVSLTQLIEALWSEGIRLTFVKDGKKLSSYQDGALMFVHRIQKRS